MAVAGPVSKPLSGQQISELAGGARVVRYPDLAEYGSWSALMQASSGKVACLFLTTSPTDGHWLALFNGPDGRHVFDPLGVALDKERSYISAGAQSALGETQPIIHNLLMADGPGAPPIHVSKAHFQADRPDVNTCGRWSGLRLRQRAMTDDAFQAWVSAGMRSTGLASDAWVDAVTNGRAPGPGPGPAPTLSGGMLGGRWARHASRPLLRS